MSAQKSGCAVRGERLPAWISGVEYNVRLGGSANSTLDLPAEVCGRGSLDGHEVDAGQVIDRPLLAQPPCKILQSSNSGV